MRRELLLSCSIIALASPRARGQTAPQVYGRVDIFTPFAASPGGGLIDVVHGVPGGLILARFAHEPLDDTIIAQVGACTLSRPATLKGLPAGTLRIEGLPAWWSLHIEPMGGVGYARGFDALPRPGTTLQVEVDGDGDVPHLLAKVQMPVPIPGFTVTPTATEVIATWTPVPHAGSPVRPTRVRWSAAR